MIGSRRSHTNTLLWIVRGAALAVVIAVGYRTHRYLSVLLSLLFALGINQAFTYQVRRGETRNQNLDRDEAPRA
jgi:hypothetical protein